MLIHIHVHVHVLDIHVHVHVLDIHVRMYNICVCIYDVYTLYVLVHVHSCDHGNSCVCNMYIQVHVRGD